MVLQVESKFTRIELLGNVAVGVGVWLSLETILKLRNCHFTYKKQVHFMEQLLQYSEPFKE